MTGPATGVGPKQTATKLVDGLHFDRPWDIEDFTASVAMTTGKPITVDPLPASLEDEITGLWVPEPGINRIYVTSRGDDAYREHVRCHELAHIVIAHHGGGQVDTDTYQAQLIRIAPNLPAGFLRQLVPAQVCYSRASYLSELEQTAEWMATLIQSKADSLRSRMYVDGHDTSDYAVAERFLKAVGWRG